jgi:hypothetical protein
LSFSFSFALYWVFCIVFGRKHFFLKLHELDILYHLMYIKRNRLFKKKTMGIYGCSSGFLVYGFVEKSKDIFDTWDSENDTRCDPIDKYATHCVRYMPMGVVYGISCNMNADGTIQNKTEYVTSVDTWRARVAAARGEEAVSTCGYFVCTYSDDEDWTMMTKYSIL